MLRAGEPRLSVRETNVQECRVRRRSRGGTGNTFTAAPSSGAAHRRESRAALSTKHAPVRGIESANEDLLEDRRKRPGSSPLLDFLAFGVWGDRAERTLWELQSKLFRVQSEGDLPLRCNAVSRGEVGDSPFADSDAIPPVYRFAPVGPKLYQNWPEAPRRFAAATAMRSVSTSESSGNCVDDFTTSIAGDRIEIEPAAEKTLQDERTAMTAAVPARALE